MSTRKLDTFLSETTSPLRRLSKIAQRQLAVSRIWESIVPIGLARSCRVARLEEGSLTLYADNGAIAAKINQQLPSLQAKLQKRGCQVTKINVMVQVKAPTHIPKTVAKPGVSTRAITSFEKLASELPDSKLKYALTNFIRNHKPSDQG